MKTLKRIFPFIALLGFFVGGFSSCEDDCGCDPVISHILPSKAASKDSIIASAASEEFIVIVGENLAAVTQVLFDNVPVTTLNPAFITDNYIVLQIPEVSASTQRITLITGQGRKAEADFAINIPAPVISMFYCEFLPAGDILRVKGRYFFNPKVSFYAEDGSLIEAEVETKGSTELFIEVPEGVAYSKPIVVETGSGKTESDVLFRDRRNIIIDFDGFQATVEGTMVQYPLDAEDRKPEWKSTPVMQALLPAGFELPVGCDGLYGQINQTKDPLGEGNYIAYYADRGGRSPILPLYGDFKDIPVSQLVLKFEVFVPEKYAINGAPISIFFPPRGNNGGAAEGRELSKPAANPVVPGTWWVPFQAVIDKPDGKPWAWKWGSAAGVLPFDTEWKELSYSGNWQTVSVPLATFMWNVADKGPATEMEMNFADYDGSDALAAVKQLIIGDVTQAMGDFSFIIEPWCRSHPQPGIFPSSVNRRAIHEFRGTFGCVGIRTW